MKSLSTPLFSMKTVIILPVILFGAIALMVSVPAFSQDNITKDTDLSQMDWSDGEEKNEDLSKMDWSDGPDENVDLSKESWEDEPADKQGGAGGDLSEMSWEDEEGEGSQDQTQQTMKEMTAQEEKALDDQERKTHIYGFLMFIGYILGALLTGFYTRNRKLAVEYPPELLMVLHTVWPIEWLFLIFAGKKVR